MATKNLSDIRPLAGPGAIKPKQRGLARLATHRTFRRIMQSGFALFILYTLIEHIVVGESGENVTASAEAFCPFGGLENLFVYVIGAGKFVPHTHLSNIVLAVATLLTALVARNAFCGWVCPLGFLQELTSGLSGTLQKRVPAVRRGVKWVKVHGAPLAALDRPLKLVKYAVLAWAVIGAGVYGVMVFRDYDPWAALLTIVELSLTPGLVILAITLVASFFVERPWCRYACPLGAATGLLGVLSPVYLKREAPLCKGCAVCNKACPMGIDVANATTIKSPNCIGCLECTAICPRAGALELKVGLPVVGK